MPRKRLMMRGRNAKLFRDLFHDRQSYRRFKKAYSSSPLEKRLATIAIARRIKATGEIHNVEVPND